MQSMPFAVIAFTLLYVFGSIESMEDLSPCSTYEYKHEGTISRPAFKDVPATIDMTSCFYVLKGSSVVFKSGAGVYLEAFSTFAAYAGSIALLSEKAWIWLQDSGSLRTWGRLVMRENATIKVANEGSLWNRGEMEAYHENASLLQSAVIIGKGAEVQMDRDSIVRAASRSRLRAFQVCSSAPAPLFYLASQSAVYLRDGSNLQVIGRGWLVIRDKSLVQINGASVIVAGRLEVGFNSTLDVEQGASISINFIGDMRAVDPEASCNTSSSLVFGKEDLSLTVKRNVALQVSPNVNCLLKRSTEMSENLTLEAGKDYGSFMKCFRTYEELMSEKRKPL